MLFRSVRKQHLIDCQPHWVQYSGRETDSPDAVYFECPEGHDNCRHVIPFTPALDGTTQPVKQTNGVQWERTGDTFETLTLTPSIRRTQRYANREAALAAGCLEDHLDDSLFCAFHGFIKNGAIEFCGDSK